MVVHDTDCIGACDAISAGIAGARAQSFPSKQVTMIVPFPAGGGSDILARVVAEGMGNRSASR